MFFGAYCVAASITVSGNDAGIGASAQALAECAHTTDYKMSAETFLSVVDHEARQLGFCGPIVITFNGDIDAESMTTLRRLVLLTVERPNIPGGWLMLNSNGGNGWESLSFARLLRERNIRDLVIEVPKGSHCYSSCVFIVAGAFRRAVYGEIGIHRLYFPGKAVNEAGYKSLQEAYDSAFAQLKSFFASVNLSDRLASDMWLVSSDRLRILTKKELDDYGLSSDDVVLTELENGKLRAACGEAAPAVRDDFFKNVFYQCLGANGLMDKTCFKKLGRHHPYCRCFVSTEDNSHFGLVCE